MNLTFPEKRPFPARPGLRAALVLGTLALLGAQLPACSGHSADPDATVGPVDDAAEAGPSSDLPPGSEDLGAGVTLSVATWNVENFFDTIDDPDHQDTVVTQAELDSKMAKIGAALRDLKADVLALEEVENLALLKSLNTKQLSSLGYTDLRLVSGNDIRGINVALLSRYTVKSAISHIQDRFKGVDGDTTTYGFSRDCLEVKIQTGKDKTLVLLINHLRAKDESTDGTDDARRYAQAQQVRKIADSTLKSTPKANLAVLGDLNDLPSSRTLTLIMNGTPAITDSLAAIAAADRYTHYYSGKTEQLDYILLSPGLKEDAIAGSAKAIHTSLYHAASDHYPVYARFNLR
jgi:predicted extracellular nuclease